MRERATFFAFVPTELSRFINMQVYTLFSGSSGNSVYVKDGNTEILIDAGKSAGAIEKSLSALNSSLKNIGAVFLTHEHTDHTVGLEIISKKHHIPVHMTEESYKKCANTSPYLSSCVKRHESRYCVRVGSLSVSSFEIPHDSAQNVGYIIENDSNERLGIATDMGYVTDEIQSALLGCSFAVIESNHDIGMLKSGPYPYFLKQRILSSGGHLCNEDCAALAVSLAGSGVRSITLAHLSRENNTPDKAFEVTRRALDTNGFRSVNLNVASPVSPVLVWQGEASPHN